MSEQPTLDEVKRLLAPFGLDDHPDWQPHDGGRLAPEAFATEVESVLAPDLPVWLPRPHPRPLTRRQRLRLRVAAARWWVHDRLFPDCHRDWWYE